MNQRNENLPFLGELWNMLITPQQEKLNKIVILNPKGGCGKSTLLNIISGLLVPSEGRVLFDDRDVTTLPPDQRNIAQVFQFPVIYDTMTVRQNLAFPLRNRGVDAGSRRHAGHPRLKPKPRQQAKDLYGARAGAR